MGGTTVWAHGVARFFSGCVLLACSSQTSIYDSACGPGTTAVKGVCVVAEGGTEGGSAGDADAAMFQGDGGSDAANGEPQDSSLSHAQGDAAMCTPIATDGGFDGGACNSLSLQGAGVQATCPSDPLPTFTGGTIEDGSYLLQSIAFYNGCPGEAVTARASVRFCGDQEQSVGYFMFGSTELRNLLDNAFTVAGSTISTTVVCPAAASATPQADQYTASSTQFVIASDFGSGVTEVLTYQLEQ
jgi:hypothetical protein